MKTILILFLILTAGCQSVRKKPRLSPEVKARYQKQHYKYLAENKPVGPVIIFYDDGSVKIKD